MFFCDSRSETLWRLNGRQPLRPGKRLDELALDEVMRKVANGPFRQHGVEIQAVEIEDGSYYWVATWAGDNEVARSGKFKFATPGLHPGLTKFFRAVDQAA